jgi:hypothetical protein
LTGLVWLALAVVMSVFGLRRVGRHNSPGGQGLGSAPMGKKDRHTPRMAFVTLRDLPGTRIMFWVVDECPYCGERHLHPAGNLRTADPSDRLGEVPAVCDPTRVYELALPPRPKKKAGKTERRRERQGGKRDVIDDDKW